MAMPRFLIVAGIMFTIVAVDVLPVDVEEPEAGSQAVTLDKAIISVPRAAAPQAYSPGNAPAIYTALRIAPAAAIAGANVRTDEARFSPSQMLTSASLDIANEEIDQSLVMLSPYERALAVQTELKRLSCYEAKIDGIWGKMSREAVSKFNEHSDSSFDLNESAELLTALKDAPDGLCDRDCSSPGNSCEIKASVEENMETPAQMAVQTEEKEAPSYLPPWMRGQKIAAADDDSETEVSETYSATHTSVSRRVHVKRRPSRRTAKKTPPRQERNWLPESWPGMD